MPAVRTHPGITRRILIAFVLLTLLPAAGIAYLGMHTVGKVIDQRLVRERAANAGRIISEMRLPLTPLMMRRLSEMFGRQDKVAAELQPDAVGEAIASSMTPAQEKEFLAQLQGRATLPGTVQIGGHAYVIGSGEIRDVATNRSHTLYLLVDQHVLDEAKTAAVRPILWGAIPALLAVLVAAFVISSTITRPIRRLSAQIEAQIAEERHEGRTKDEGRRQKDEPGGGSGSSLGSEPGVDGAAFTGNYQLATTDSSSEDSSAISLKDVDLDAPRELADLASTFNRMLARLRHVQQRLIEASRLAAIGKIAASVAHEVRNPLAGIRMNLQLLQQHLARAGQSDESLNIAIAELDRLDSIVQEMLILGKEAQPSLQRVDLCELAQEVLQLLDRRLRHAGVTPAIEGEPVEVMADPSQIKQVMLNLVLNAIDAMPQGGALTIRTLRADGPLLIARLEIDDTGSGVALDASQDPFAWFSTSKSAGHGIGLAVCKQIIDAHAGRIGLERLPQGTRAWFELRLG